MHLNWERERGKPSFLTTKCGKNLSCIGNWDTLEVKPKEKGLDTRHELIKFYEEHYSANLMHLVVYTKGK